jgi:hypothetical protein
MVNRLNPMVAVAAGSSAQARRWAGHLQLAKVRFNMVESISGERSEIWVDADDVDEARSIVIHVAVPGGALIW